MFLTGKAQRERFIHPASLIPGTGAGTVSGDWLTCTTAGTFYAPSKQRYGVWEFNVNKGADGNESHIGFISNGIGGYNEYDGYYILLKDSESFRLQKNTNGSGASILIETAASYIANNTEYPILIARLKMAGTFSKIIPSMTTTYPADTFAAFIKVGLTDCVLVDVSGGSGSNPVTNSDYTKSDFIVADLDVGDKIGKITYKPYL